MNRVPGKYLVWVIVGLNVLVFVGALILSLNLAPAADRFHNRSVPTHKESHPAPDGAGSPGTGR